MQSVNMNWGSWPPPGSKGETMEANRCQGAHEIYVAEVLYVEKDGKLVVVTVCRACDSVTFHEKVVAAPGAQAVLLKNAKE